MTTTFKCQDVKPREPYGPSVEKLKENFSQADFLSNQLSEAFRVKVEAAGLATDGNTDWLPLIPHAHAAGKNPLVSAMLYAYDQHWEMVFRPDDIWLTIAHGLARHVNVNSEELRPHFVPFEGKKTITVRRDSFVKGSPHNDWPGTFGEFSDQLSEWIGKKRDLIVSNFSTTSPIDRAASEVVLMDAMQCYFDYRVMTCSGFSHVTVEGHADDWENIKQRVQTMTEFDLGWWTFFLEPVIDQFIAAAKGNPDPEFFARAVNRHAGSGRDDISGWCLALCPYVDSGIDNFCKFVKNKLVNWEETDSRLGRGIPPASFGQLTSKVPFIWDYFGREHEMSFLGGLMAPVIDVVNQRVGVTSGWAVGDV